MERERYKDCVNLICASKLRCSVSVCLQCIMHLIEEHYYTINKVFIKILGIWPYEKSQFALLQRLLITILIITYIGMQVIVSFIIKIIIICDYIYFEKSNIFLKKFALIIL